MSKTTTQKERREMRNPAKMMPTTRLRKKSALSPRRRGPRRNSREPRNQPQRSQRSMAQALLQAHCP